LLSSQGALPKKDASHRQQLVQTLQEQYQHIEIGSAVSSSLDALLQEQTFTITTAHQPCVLGGPLYFIYKIVSAIKLAEKYREAHPAYHFVPVYWMGTEDHDFAEINHLHLYSNTYTWEQEGEGPVGRRIIDEAFMSMLEEVFTALGNSSSNDHIKGALMEAFQPGNSLAFSTRKWVHELFKDYGLVILDPDHATFKKMFLPVMQEELMKQNSSLLIEPTLNFLADNYKVQATPREINLFWTGDGGRSRVVKEGNDYAIVQKTKRFTAAEIQETLAATPNEFSPNVILRPVYQATLLPDIAFVGGPGEISYWLQLYALFPHYEQVYPRLVLRDGALLLDEKSVTKLTEMGFSLVDLFKHSDELVAMLVQKEGGASSSLTDESEQLQSIWESVTTKVSALDQSLKGASEGEKQKMLKSIELLQTKMERAVKRREEERITRLKSIKDKAFPQDTLQERHDNFLMHSNKFPGGFLEALHAAFDADEKVLKVLVY
jgi:bacillithiol synthase